MKLFVFALFVCYVSALPELPECKDPTFACQTLEHAMLCDTVHTCIHDIWETMAAPNDNDEICDICKEMVKEARDQLLSNMTQEEIKEVFEGSCKLLPIKLVADACIKVVDEIIPQLVEMLASRMDPNMVCTVSGLCNPVSSAMDSRIVKIFKKALKDQGDECADCTKVLTDVQTFLKDTTPLSNGTSVEDKVKAYLAKVCDEKIPKYLCDLVLDHYLDEILKEITSQTPTQLCASAGVCPQQCQVKAPVKDELVCEFCTHVLQHIKDMVTTNTTEEEFKTALLNFCKQLGSYSDKCTSMVNEYYDMLFDYIKSIDVKGTCTLIGLCDNTKGCLKPMVKIVPAIEPMKMFTMIKLTPAMKVEQSNFMPLVSLFPAQSVNKKDMRKSNEIPQQLPLERFNRPYPIFEQDTQCAICQAFSFFLEKDLNGDFSKDNVRSVIDNICSKWMTELPAQCQSIVEKYGEKVRHHIAKDVPINYLCQSLKVCPLKENTEISVPVKPQNAKDDPFCQLCKDAFNEVEKELSDPATKQQLESMLGRICTFLPDSMKDDCTKFINQNVDALIDILQQELNPNNICPALNLCPSSKRVVVSQRVKDLECDVCKEVVSSLRQKLQDPESKVVVQTFLEEVCLRLPSSIGTECKNFIDGNIDTVMNLLIETLDPDTVCGIFKICPTSLIKVIPRHLKDNQCDMCKQVIGVWEEMLKNNRTEAQLKSLLEKGCSYLPSSISAKCTEFVDRYSDTIINLITEELNPEIVCEALKVCPGTVKKVQKPKVKDVECDLCKEVVTKVEDMVKDKRTEEEIQAALDKVCGYLPKSIEAKCTDFVNTYTPTIITLLMAELDPDTVCAELGLCQATLVKVEQPKVNDVECDLCKEVVGKVEDMVKDKKTEEEIQAALDKVCGYLPKSIEAKCTDFVNTYTPTIITLLMAELDPDTVCAELGLCQATLVKVEQPKVNDVECDLCKEVVGKVEDMVKDKKTEDEIQAALDKVCGYLPKSIEAKCTEFVNTYTQTIITLLMEELDPDMVCAELGLCQSAVKQQKAKDVKGMECDLCKIAIGKIEDMVKDPKTEEAIRSALDHVCSILPKSLAEKCENFINTYTETIVTLLMQELDPDAICSMLNVCPAKDIECEMCQDVLHFLQQQLLSADMQDEIKNFMKKICTVLPGTLSDNCVSFVNQYADSLLALLAQELDPSVLCHMCSNQTKVHQHKNLPLVNFNMDECSMCTTVVDYVDKLLEEDEVDKEITKVIEKVCSIVPGSYKDQCASLLEAYGPYILQMIGQLADSKQVCQDIDICPRSSHQAHLIGGSKCTFGPSYWCRTTAHASACKATVYCQDKVWKNM